MLVNRSSRMGRFMRGRIEACFSQSRHLREPLTDAAAQQYGCSRYT
jgi:hypothetical protein